MADIYFSFDNPLYFHSDVNYIQGHPLTQYMYKPLLILGNILQGSGTLKAKNIFFVIFFNCLSALSCVYIYRYLRNIINLKTIQAAILCTFWGIMSINLIISFTPESFSMSSVVLISMILYYSNCIVKGQGTKPIIDAIYCITLGGITITNLPKIL